MVNQHLAHGPGRDREEMRAVLDACARRSRELHVRFVYEGCWLEGMTVPFGAKSGRRYPSQLHVDQFVYSVEGGRVSITRYPKQTRDFSRRSVSVDFGHLTLASLGFRQSRNARIDVSGVPGQYPAS